jgi:lipopolysaccharide cholinephosphotransferase
LTGEKMPTIQDLQEREKKMISDVDSLLKENHIQYWLLGGSVLGSIRHKGFIPWDDDIDVGVMRYDFDRVEKLLSQLDKPYTYESAEYHTIPYAPIGHLHFVDKGFKLENSPVVDIFALDGVPSQKILQKYQRFFANVHHLCVYRKPAKNRGIINKVFTFLVIFLLPKKILDWLQVVSLRIVTQWSCRTSPLLGNIFGAWKEKEIFKRSMFENSTVGTFEEMKLSLPANPYEYLTQLYGNYMELPPIEKRVPRHRTFND